MIKRVLMHLFLRRKWNRTRRWMVNRATSRAMATVCITGRMWRRV